MTSALIREELSRLQEKHKGGQRITDKDIKKCVAFFMSETKSRQKMRS